MWLVCSSIATLIVTGDCPYSDKEIVKIMSDVSLAVCKAYKEVHGLTEGTVDKDSILKNILGENR
jgi:spore coat polysaccharide biosynthesis protein SpsF (cytidylyltransferase family)